jgi:hypothetical protein
VAFCGGVPDERLYERTKTVVTPAVGQQRELHPEAIACAGHDGCRITRCPPRRPPTQGVLLQKSKSAIFDGCNPLKY